jgi:hypothetical protein
MARRWSPERVIAEIHRIYGKLPCSHPARKRLYEVAQQYFGSLDQALAAAGVKRLNQTWSKAKIIQRIRNEYPQRGLAMWEDYTFKTAVYRHFRSRSTALQSAGFSAIRLKWTAEIIIDKLRTHAQRYESFDGLPEQDTRLYQAARRHFGSWHQAIQAAGLAAPKRWTETTIVEAIKERQRR